jgi:hypothetical protein
LTFLDGNFILAFIFNLPLHPLQSGIICSVPSREENENEIFGEEENEDSRDREVKCFDQVFRLKTEG